MDDDELTAAEAAELLHMNVQTLRRRLRRERPEGTWQVPPQRGGNWFLRRTYVEQLAAENGLQKRGQLPKPIVNQWPTPTRESAVLTLRGAAPQATVVHGVWSDWFDFSHAMDHIPPFPGVYMLRPAEKPNAAPVYVGMAGLRQGNGLRGRLAVYASGKGAVSGLGEHAFDRALADSGWIQERLGEALRGQAQRAKTVARLAIDHLRLEIRWKTVENGGEAHKLERELIAKHRATLWNR